MAGAGILIRGGDALEAAARIKLMVFDKTGTLTLGRPAVTAIVVPEAGDPARVLHLAAAAESRSEHPLAGAVLAAARERGLAWSDPTAVEAVAGRGVKAQWEGCTLRVGSRAWLEADGVATEALARQAAPLAAEAHTLLYVAQDAQLVGAVAVADVVRPDARECVARLRRAGIEVAMITGDERQAAEAVGRATGIERVLAGVLPAEKAARIGELQGSGRVVGMAGDGLNDAPALAQADVGFALGSGTDVAIEAADVTVVGERLLALPLAIRVSRATLRNIRQNLMGAFFYNLIAIVVATGVLVPLLGSGFLLSPLLAGAAMSLSSITVVANALRLRRVELED
jgi:Cu+-exporting ATPase